MGEAAAAGAAAGVAGGVIQGIAGQQIASAQAGEARAARALALSYAAPTPQEIAALQQSSDLLNSDIKRTSDILASVDPAMLELGKQTLAMLRGEKEVGTNKFMRQQIDQQRNSFEAKMKAQLGPGWETSTAGQQAKAQFEMQAAGALEQNQQNTLNSYLGITSNLAARGQSQNIAGAQNLAGLYGSISSRQANAAIGTSSALIGTAGAGAYGMSALGGTLGQLGGLGLAYGLMGKGSGGGTDYAKMTSSGTAYTLNPGSGILGG